MIEFLIARELGMLDHLGLGNDSPEPAGGASKEYQGKHRAQEEPTPQARGRRKTSSTGPH